MDRWDIVRKKFIPVPEVDRFIDAIHRVEKEHGLSIAHEDGHGSFIVRPIDEGDLDWLMDASWDNRKSRL